MEALPNMTLVLLLLPLQVQVLVHRMLSGAVTPSMPLRLDTAPT
jgi:hypothetical protein